MDRLIELFIYFYLIGIGFVCGYIAKLIKDRDKKVSLVESSRNMEEIEEIINCDADAEIKLEMISNIVYSKPHYFKILKY